MDRTPDDEVLLGLARLAMGASVRAAEEIGGISPVQLRVLTVIRALEECNLGQLAEELGVGISTTSRMLDRLSAQKLIDRRTSRRYRRQISVQLSRRGEALLAHYDDVRIGELQRSLDGVATEGRGLVLAGLRTWMDALDADGAVQEDGDRQPSAGSAA